MSWTYFDFGMKLKLESLIQNFVTIVSLTLLTIIITYKLSSLNVLLRVLVLLAALLPYLDLYLDLSTTILLLYYLSMFKIKLKLCYYCYCVLQFNLHFFHLFKLWFL